MRDQRGYYSKFQVIRRDSGREVEQATFTLIPERDPHAIVAIRAYADSCEGENPRLAINLRALVDGIE